MEIGVMSGLTITGGVNWFYRRELDRKVMIIGMVMGGFGGAIWGILQSTEYAMKMFEGLGSEYQLGRLAISEIEEFRLDNKQFFKDQM